MKLLVDNRGGWHILPRLVVNVSPANNAYLIDGWQQSWIAAKDIETLTVSKFGLP